MISKCLTGALLICGVISLVCPSPICAEVPIKGRAVLPAVAGRETEGYQALKGASIFVSPKGDTPGVSALSGDDGHFSITPPAGEYAILLEPAETWRRGRIFTGEIPRDAAGAWILTLQPDYNCSFNTATEWGENPWRWGTEFQQTFIAQGTSITSAAFKLAGVNGKVSVEVSVLDGPNGKPIGPGKTLTVKAIDDQFVTWQPGEVSTVPGQTCGLQIKTVPPRPVGFFIRREHGFGYPYGELTVDGKPGNCDGYIYIGSDADGAMLTYDAAGTVSASSSPAEKLVIPFTAKGTSLAAVSLPLVGPIPAVRIAIQQAGQEGEQALAIKTISPVIREGNRFLAGAAWLPGEIALNPGQQYAVIVTSASSDRGIAGYKAEAPSAGGLAVRVYEYPEQPLAYALPPLPDWSPDESEEHLPLNNTDFETGNQEGWESAWGGGDAFTAVAGADFKPELFSGDAAKPYQGQFCGIVAAEKQKVQKLIRRWFDWPYAPGKGLFHARIWVASSDGADKLEKPLKVQLCVSDHGSNDAGGVDWTEAIVSPGKWTMIQCRPVIPTSNRLSLFLLLTGGSEDTVSYIKVDNLQVVVDEKPGN